MNNSLILDELKQINDNVQTSLIPIINQTVNLTKINSNSITTSGGSLDINNTGLTNLNTCINTSTVYKIRSELVDDTGNQIYVSSNKLNVVDKNSDTINTNIIDIKTNLDNTNIYLIDGRLNMNYRYKNIHGVNNDIVTSDYQFSVNLQDSTTYTIDDCSPPIGDVSYVYSTSVNDDLIGIGARIIYLKYIDKNGDTKEEDLEMDGVTHVNLAYDNLRELLEFYVKTWGGNLLTQSALINAGTIYLCENVSDKIISAILPGKNTHQPIQIQVPNNGVTLLKNLELYNQESNNFSHIDFRLYKVGRYLDSGDYNFDIQIIYSLRCRYQSDIIIDLSFLPPIYGYTTITSNMCIVPMLIGTNESSFSTYGSINLSAINYTL
jgi:hypothetical protein